MDKQMGAGAELIERISEDAGLYAMGGTVAKIVEMSSDDDGGVGALAGAVLSDVALSQKILRMANMAAYRGSAGNAMATVSKAIFVLGFEAVKAAALALLLVEGLSDRGQAASVSREIALALGASLVARRLSASGAGGGGESEDAGLAALFRNLGSLLLASKGHGLYEALRERVSGGEAVGRASHEVLGCSLEQVASSAMRAWGLPEWLVMAATGPPGRGGPAAGRSERARQLACAGREASELIGAGGGARLAGWCAKHAGPLGMTAEALGELMGRVGAEAAGLMGSLGCGAPEGVAPAHGSSDVGVGVPGTLPFEMLMDATAGPVSGERQLHPSGKPIDAKDILLAGIGEAAQMFASGRAQGAQVVMGIMEALHVGMGFRLTVFCARDPVSGAYRARLALGAQAARALEGFAWCAAPAPARLDVFSLALAKGVDVTIADAGAENIKGLLPPWHRALLPDSASFVVLPLVVDGKPVGLLYGDRAAKAPEGVSPDEAAMMRTLKAQAIATLRKGGAQAAASKR